MCVFASTCAIGSPGEPGDPGRLGETGYQGRPGASGKDGAPGHRGPPVSFLLGIIHTDLKIFENSESISKPYKYYNSDFNVAL